MIKLRVFDAQEVAAQLDYPGCIDAVRSAMTALSQGRTRQLLRTMIPIGDQGVFAQMPGALGEDQMFGAKLISVLNDPTQPGRRRHRGVVVMFEPQTGAPVCVADAEEVTLVRTAAMTAVATDAMARPDAAVLTLYGCGAQALTHVRALSLVRPWRELRLWGRSPERAADAAARIAEETGMALTVVADGQAAADGADVICTLTHAAEPILRGEWIAPGAHVNLVGSSGPGSVEVDEALVARSRYVADSRASILAQGSEFLRAKDAGLVGDGHIVAEIGEVLSGSRPGRLSDDDVTVFKSIGHAVQDLAAVAYLWRKAA